MVDVELLTSLEPLPGGRSGRTLLGTAAGTRVVARLYVGPDDHGPAAHEVHAALLALVSGLVPVPGVLELRGPRDDLPALLLTEHLPGVPAAGLLAELDDPGRARLGRGLGRIAGTLAGIPFARRGAFRDASLGPRPDGGASAGDVEDAGTASLAADEPPAWSVAAERVRDAEPRAVLVHGDLGLDNVLVDPGSLAVTGVVDWERAHAGHPRTDLGRLLRGAGDRGSPYVAGVLVGWAAVRGGPDAPTGDGTDPGTGPGTDLGAGPDADLAAARAADLPVLRAAVAADGPGAPGARELLAAIARHGDVHAVPSGWTVP